MKIKYFIFMVIFFIVFNSCNLESNLVVENFQKKEKAWIFLVYMAADNDLESAAIRDFNELEAAQFDRAKISILVLLDRSPFYDNSNGDWSGTRLYEMCYDPNGVDNIIRSKEIVFPLLDIGEGKQTNVNTADPFVLEGTIDFVKQKYQAENYGLIMWGHGTGWRSPTQNNYRSASNESLGTKAFAFDDTSQTYMSLSSFHKAIAGKGLKCIGFDICFGAVLELAYEICDETEWIIASPSTVPFEGWDYKNLFHFFTKTDFSPESFCVSILEQFQLQYAQEDTASLSIIKTDKIAALKESFDSFAKEVASCIVDSEERHTCLGWILEEVLTYKDTSAKTDIFVDIASFVEEGGKRYQDLMPQAEIVLLKLAEVLPLFYSTEKRDYGGLGVFFIGLENGIPNASHPNDYVQGSDFGECSRFVKESDGWVPHKNGGDSLLDVLFYTTF
ncbi:MAG TPA: clostripain-related cysteine peptidase [Treponemataceae bacterium]|jgi:hypothetical protein|nr:clostripain-related cysteine peptidase [Treponemataceae bacterium]